jgi:RNA polymerase sigma-B factor
MTVAKIPSLPGRDSARGVLIEEHLSLARVLARRFAGGGEQLDDLVQVGAIGLIKAADRFDPGRGVPFAAYAVPTILGELRRHLRDRAWPVRVPRAAYADGMRVRSLPLSEAERRDPAGELELELGESRALIAAGIRALDERSRRILHLRFYAGLSQSGIAAELGLSQVHVSRLLRSSLDALRAELGVIAA